MKADSDLPGGATAAQVTKRHLEAKRREIAAEIRNYPGPIAGCDQQFNHLLERRRAIVKALSEFDTR